MARGRRRTGTRRQDARAPTPRGQSLDLRGLPPVLIQAGDAEILRDDSTRFAAAAQAAGVDVTLEIGGDAACLARVRRAAAGGGRGRRADRQLAARGPAHPVTAPSATAGAKGVFQYPRAGAIR